MPANKNAIARYRIIAHLLEMAGNKCKVSIDQMRADIMAETGQHVSVTTIEKDIHALRYDKGLGVFAPIAACPGLSGGGFYLTDTINIQSITPFKTIITMKLKTFNTLNVPSNGGTRSSTINIGPQGEFSLSESAAELLGVSTGSRVQLHQDEDSPKDWYISPTDRAEGFELRSSKGSKSLRFRNSAMRAILLKSLGKQPEKTAGVKMPVCAGEFEGEYWTILTAALNRP